MAMWSRDSVGYKEHFSTVKNLQSFHMDLHSRVFCTQAAGQKAHALRKVSAVHLPNDALKVQKH